MKTDDGALEQSDVVANARMNRGRNLRGVNSYARELGFDPIDFLSARTAPRWLDLACGTGCALIQAAPLLPQGCIEGVDLVPMFDTGRHPNLRLQAVSFRDWQPDGLYDLVTCVHGLHYIGDKLDFIRRCIGVLAMEGRFAAHLDLANLSGSTHWKASFDRHGFRYDSRRHLLTGGPQSDPRFPYRYLGYDDTVGPNYTFQEAVASYYEAHQLTDNARRNERHQA